MAFSHPILLIPKNFHHLQNNWRNCEKLPWRCKLYSIVQLFPMSKEPCFTLVRSFNRCSFYCQQKYMHPPPHSWQPAQSCMSSAARAASPQTQCQWSASWITFLRKFPEAELLDQKVNILGGFRYILSFSLFKRYENLWIKVSKWRHSWCYFLCSKSIRMRG